MKKKNKNGIYFLPLGGADEIGMNMYAYGVNGKWIVIDAGYGFLNDDYPGMDMCYASPAFLEEFKEDVLGLFITHGHEDHMGAIAQIWPALQCPVYATPFAAGLMKERLKEYNLENAVDINKVQTGSEITAGDFMVKFVPLVHSVPETCGLLSVRRLVMFFMLPTGVLMTGISRCSQPIWKSLKQSEKPELICLCAIRPMSCLTNPSRAKVWCEKSCWSLFPA